VSPLTSGPSAGLNDAERKNPGPGAGLDLRRAQLRAHHRLGPAHAPTLAIEIRNTKGEKQWEWQTTAAELAAGTRP
jgi:hypothetical protein